MVFVAATFDVMLSYSKHMHLCFKCFNFDCSLLGRLLAAVSLAARWLVVVVASNSRERE